VPTLGLPTRARAPLVLLLGALLWTAPGQRPALGAERPSILRCELDGTLDAGTAAYLADCVKTAEQGEHHALLVRIDTPGGALAATQRVVQDFLAARVPVLAWVGPSGGRAGSAGTFLVLASHLAGMADATRIGAAHPVMLGGGDAGGGDPHSAAKLENDTAAFAESVARARGRNAEWAAKAVRESISVPATKARELGVVELVAASEDAFLAAADSRPVVVDGKSVKLHTQGAPVVSMELSFQQRLLHALANPALAYLLFLVGGLGIAIELTSPGMILPGVVGALCLVLAMMALATLPVRAGAVALLVLGVGLLVAELFVTSGIAGVAGVGLLVLGGVLLVERFSPGWFSDLPLVVPPRLIVPTAVLAGGASVFVLARLRQARALPPQVGEHALLGEQGQALTPISTTGGEVFVHGERWRAVSEKPVEEGRRVVVRSLDGLTLHVQEVG
jgi:membrane-bound serine protease (ClpP class)